MRLRPKLLGAALWIWGNIPQPLRGYFRSRRLPVKIYRVLSASPKADTPTIMDLIGNGTLSAEMAATMWAFVSEQRSFISAAVPRLAGKTAVTNAILNMRPPDVPVHQLSGDMAEMDSLKRQATGGYLSISEISKGRKQDYLWGESTRRAFDTLTAGYALVATMHASGVDDVFEQICVGNGVGDDAASRISFVIYIRRFGDQAKGLWRRVAEVHEIERVEGGRAHGQLLHKWMKDEDRFEMVEWPRTLQYSRPDIAARVDALKDLAKSGRRSATDVARLVAGFASRD